jgi:hypothetical protein
VKFESAIEALVGIYKAFSILSDQLTLENTGAELAWELCLLVWLARFPLLISAVYLLVGVEVSRYQAHPTSSTTNYAKYPHLFIDRKSSIQYYKANSTHQVIRVFLLLYTSVVKHLRIHKIKREENSAYNTTYIIGTNQLLVENLLDQTAYLGIEMPCTTNIIYSRWNRVDESQMEDGCSLRFTSIVSAKRKST